MAFDSPSAIIAALEAARETIISKAALTSQVGGQFTSLWRATGVPAQGAIPAAAAVLNNSTLGALTLPARTGLQKRGLLWQSTTLALNHGFAMADRLAHMGGLNGTLTTAQTVNLDVSGTGDNLPARIGTSDYRNVRWFLEWYGTTGATAVNATVAVTYSDNSTGNIVMALTASVAASRMIEILSPNGLGIRSIQSVTLSATTGAAGNFGVTALRVFPLTYQAVGNQTVSFDWAQLGLPIIEDSACLTPVLLVVGGTNTLAIFGVCKIGVA